MFTYDKIPTNWVSATLNEISSIISGNPAPQGEAFFINGVYPFVRVQDLGKMGNEVLLQDTKDHINEKAISKRKIFPKNTILFTKSGMSTLLNQRAILGKDMYVVSHIGGIIPFTGIDYKYLYYFMKTVDFKILTHATTLPSLQLSKVGSLSAPIPPLAEQVRIVSKIEELFSRLGAGVRSLQAAQTQLEQYRQATLRQAYTGKLTKKWRQKNGQKIQSRDSLLRLILDDKWLSHYENVVWNDLPDCWIKVDLNDLSWDSQYGTSAKCRYENKGTPVLRIPNIVNGGIDLNDLKYIESEKEISFEPLSKNDFLIIRTNGSKNLIGAAALITDNFNSPHYFASYLIRFRLKDIGLIPKWINEIWKSIDIRKLILANASTSAGQYNINKTKLGNFKINIPSISEQEIIVNKLDEIHSLYKYIKYQIDKNIIISLSLKQSILKSAFEGRLVQQDPNDEPASMLLEKIKVEKASGKPSRKGRKSRGQMRLVE